MATFRIFHSMFAADEMFVPEFHSCDDGSEGKEEDGKYVADDVFVIGK